MKTNAEQERAFFWNAFNEILAENGDPFTLSSKKQWAVVNRDNPNWTKPCLSMDFLIQKRILVINIFILDDIPLYNRLLANKAQIESDLGIAPPVSKNLFAVVNKQTNPNFKVQWVQGEKGSNTKRIKTELDFTPYDHSDYWRLIEKAIPIVMSYMRAFKRYIEI